MISMMLIKLAGMKARMINGYPSTSESLLAMERNEVDGRCG
jgi:hypothetical protein